jgi:uridine kinase
MEKPFIVGITGGSGSGKTHFVNALLETLPKKDVCFISQDHYYKPRHLQIKDAQGIENFDVPEAIDREGFYADVKRVIEGNVVQKTEYTFNNSAKNPGEITFTPARILILEGLFVQYFSEIKSLLDLSIFIDVKDHVMLSRRISRDRQERGYPLEDVLYRFQYHVMPMYETLLNPLKDEADIVIPNNKSFDRAINFISKGLKSYLER